MKNSSTFSAKLFALLTVILCLGFNLSGQNDFCPGNIFQNGDVEQGTPTPNDQDINNAVGFSSIWGPGSIADYYNATSGPFTPPQPPTGNWAGFWVSNHATPSVTYREGLFNTLNTTIGANSGVYSFTFDMACLGGWGDAELGIYGIYNPSGNVSINPPITSHNPTNEGFFGATNTMELGLIPISGNACSNTKTNHTIFFDSADAAFPTNGITHILLASSNDTIAGARYIAVDNFCMVFEGPSPVDSCVTIIDEDFICNPDGSTTYSFDFIYNGTLTADNFIVTDLNGNTLFNVGGLTLNTGSTYSTVSFNIPAGLSTYCFRLRLFGEEECCHIEHCVDVPECDPCDSVWVESFPLQNDNGDCCHSIDVVNNFNGNYFTHITSTIITPGVTFSNPTANLGWTVSGGGNSLTWTPPSGFIPLGSSNGAMDFCFDNIIHASQIPQTVVFDWWQVNADGTVSTECSDTLYFDCTSCLYVSDDWIDCEPDGSYQYNFSVWNATNPAHDATDLRIVPLMGGVCLDGNGSFTPVTLPLPGAPLSSGGSANLSLNISDCGAGLSPGSQVPLRLILVDNGVDLDWCCHVDTLWVTIPECPGGNDCDCTTLPDDVAQGFTTSGSACTRTFTPVGLTDCDSVRWFIGGSGIVGTSQGNAPLTHTFSTGTYTVCMIVGRFLPDGTFCDEYEYCESFSILCPIIIDNAFPSKQQVILSIFPNPVVKEVTITIKELGIHFIHNVEIVNTKGNRMAVRKSAVARMGQNATVNMDIGALETGIYFVRVTLSNGEVRTEKIVKVE